jgi:hypothetical protein
MSGNSVATQKSVSVLDYEPRDDDLELLVPPNDVTDPEISIVIPALNEEITIGQLH